MDVGPLGRPRDRHVGCPEDRSKEDLVTDLGADLGTQDRPEGRTCGQTK